MKKSYHLKHSSAEYQMFADASSLNEATQLLVISENHLVTPTIIRENLRKELLNYDELEQFTIEEIESFIGSCLKKIETFPIKVLYINGTVYEAV